MKKPFKILDYAYENTGGNTMVGIFTVWLPEDNRVVYALTNEVGCSIVTVDYISNDLDIEDYDELTIATCDFDDLASTDDYFELYRYCLNKYTKDDCRYFGCTRSLPYHLLSDELKSKVDRKYLIWLEADCRPVETDGDNIIIHLDYTPDKDPAEIKYEVTTSYLPNEDVTVVWQHMYLGEEPVQRSLIGFYYGEPDDETTAHYSNMPLTAQFY